MMFMQRKRRGIRWLACIMVACLLLLIAPFYYASAENVENGFITSGVSSDIEERTGDKFLPFGILSTSDSPDDAVKAMSTEEFFNTVINVEFLGNPAQYKVFTQPIQGFPQQGDSFVVLSTGVAADAPGEAQTFASTDMGGLIKEGFSPHGYDVFDFARFTVRFVVPDDASTLSFQYKFATEESPTFLDSIFLDYFRVIAEVPELHVCTVFRLLPDGSTYVSVDKAIPFYGNIPRGTSENPEPPYPNPDDTVYNSVTRLQTVEVDVSKYRGKEVIMHLEIADVSDAIYDSAVFLDGFTFDVVHPPDEPVVPKFLTLPFRDPSVRLLAGWFYGDGGLHRGIDYVKGSSPRKEDWDPFDVVAAADGWAMRAFEPQTTAGYGYGNFVIIKHKETDPKGKEYMTVYAHLKEVNQDIPLQNRHSIDYNTGDRNKWMPVKRGEFIGVAGDTGAEGTGNHLHFEVMIGKYAERNKVDPYHIYRTFSFYPGVSFTTDSPPQLIDGDNFTDCGQNSLWTTCPPALIPLSPMLKIGVKSPVSLRVYDSADRLTGVVDGEIIAQIPGSSYNPDTNEVTINPALDKYRIEVYGEQQGTYTLKLMSYNENGFINFSVKEVAVTPGEVHQYDVDWNALAESEKGITIKINDEIINTSLPNTPSNPTPADQAIDVSFETIFAWDGGDSKDQHKEIYYEIYLGTNELPHLTEVIGSLTTDQDTIVYDPGLLEASTIYLWRVVARDNYGLTVDGPVWIFTTGSKMPDPGVVSAVTIETTDSLILEAGSGDTVTFSAEARDAFGNLITDDVEDFTWDNAEAGMFDEAIYGWGTYDVTATYEDVTSEIITVTVQDTIKPTISIDGTTYHDGDEIYLGYIATGYGKTVEYTKEDNGSGFAPDGELVVNDSESIPTSVAGFDLEHELTVEDRAGNATTITFTYHVLSLDDLIDLLEPVAEEDNRFRRNRTVPIKLQIYEGGEAVQMSADDLTFELKLYKVNNGVRSEREVQSTRHQGDLDEAEFRLSEDGYQYIFNLSLRGLQTGHYELDIHIKDGDGIVGTIEFEIW